MGLLSFLNNNIIGQLGDQIGTLWLGQIFYYKKFALLRFYSIEYFSNNPQSFESLYFSNIYNFLYLSFASVFGSFFTYNFLTFLFLTFNSLSLFYLLRKLKISNSVSLLFSLVFSTIPYFYSHFEHQTLLILFPSIILIGLLLNTDLITLKFRSLIYVSILLNIQVLFSLYLGYFVGIYVFLFFIISFINHKDKLIIYNFLLITTLSLVMFLFSNLSTVYSFLNPTSSVSTYDFPNNQYEKNVSTYSFERERPLEDFLYFSSRPWYYFLYHTNHPVFGNVTKGFVEYFSEELDIWIFKNHFPAEHNSSFIGITVIFIIFLGFLKKIIQRNPLVFKLFIISIFLFVLTLPPVLPLGFMNLYTPSYIMYEVFPMFRSIARLAIFIHINLFIIAAYVINELVIKSKRSKKILILAGLFVLFSFEYFGNYKSIGVLKLDETNKYLLEHNQSKYMTAAFPNSFRNEFLLNMVYHESPLFNPSGFVRNEIGFNSSNFTENIDTCENLNYFKNFNGKFIIIKNYNSFDFKIINSLDTVFESSEEKTTIKSIDKIDVLCQSSGN